MTFWLGLPHKIRWTKRKIAIGLAALTFLATVATGSIVDSIASAAKPSSEIARSNENAKLLTDAQSNSTCTNEPTVSEVLLELNPQFIECRQKKLQQTMQTLQEKLKNESNAAVKTDLEILLQSANEELQSETLDQKYELPYVNLAAEIAATLSKQFKESGSKQRNQAVLTQLTRYTGTEPGSTPLTALVEKQIRDRMTQPAVYYPEKAQLEKDLRNTNFQLDRIKTLFEKNQITGYEEAYNELKTQLTGYSTFIRQEILPKARTDFRLPPELYASRLARRGVEIPVEEVVRQAHTAFEQVQRRMDVLAPQIAQQKGFKANGYREVIQALKKEQLPSDGVVKHYEQRQKEIEDIIKRERLVTLPNRSVKIRLTTERENESFPVPQYFPPKASNKNGEGVFIIPILKQRNKNNTQVYDDFTYPAVSWTLTAHEGRPGHDLQFTTIHEKGVSKARSEFGYNSANHEGWALYAESIVLPFMPIEGQFISLQFQLLRSARAFLEPELQMGKITKADALRVLTQDAGYSNFFAQQEIRRYTVTLPGQAPSYFYGFQRLMQLRSEVEQALGKKFNQQQFHDFILSQGFMPQRILRDVMLQQFVGKATS